MATINKLVYLIMWPVRFIIRPLRVFKVTSLAAQWPASPWDEPKKKNRR